MKTFRTSLSAVSASAVLVTVALVSSGCATGTTRASGPKQTPSATEVPTPVSTVSSGGLCGEIGPFDSVCGRRFNSASAIDGASSAAWASSGKTVSVTFERLNSKPTLVLTAETIVVDAPFTSSGDELTIDLDAAMTSQNAVQPSEPNAYKWILDFLKKPVQFDLSSDDSTLELKGSSQSVTFKVDQ